MIEARRNEVYLAQHQQIYQVFTEIESHQIVTKSELFQALPKESQIICTAGLELNSDDRKALDQKDILVLDSARFTANYLAALGTEKYKIHGEDDPATIEPMYIRPFAGAN